MKSNIKTLTMVSLILQILAVLVSFIVIIMQERFIPLFTMQMIDIKIKVYPIAFFFMVSQLIIYIVFFNISHKDENEANRILGIVLIVISVALAIVSVFANVAGTIIYSRMGADTLVVYSSISTLVSYINTLLAIPATALFYIACGRFTAKAQSTDMP